MRIIRTGVPHLPVVGRVLFLFLVLLGIAGMHTVGHPGPASAAGRPADPGMTAAAHGPADGPAPTGHPVTSPTGHTGSTGLLGHSDHMHRDNGTGHAADAGTLTAPASGNPGDTSHGGGHGMDPTSVCVAVLLGGLALTWLLSAVLRGWRPGARRFAVRGLWGRLSSALPPPRPPSLLRLSVLRI